MNHKIYTQSRRSWLILFASVGSAIVIWLWLTSSIGMAQRASNSVMAVVGADAVGLYTEPSGYSQTIISTGSTLNAFGRDPSGAWIAVMTDDGAVGWVQSSQVVLFGLDQLPILTYNDLTGITPSNVSQYATPPVVGIAGNSFSNPALPPTDTPTPLPTDTPTPLPTPTAPPMPTRMTIQRDRILVVIGGRGAALWDMPNGSILRQISVGTAVNATGRTADNQWVYVTRNNVGLGWLEVSQIVVFNVESLPVTTGSGSASPSQINDTTLIRAANAEQPAQSFPTRVPQVIRQSAVPFNSTGPVMATVALTGDMLNIRLGPGTDYPVIAKAETGQTFNVLARNQSASWVQISVPGIGNELGWVSNDYVNLSGLLISLPVITPNSLPPLPAQQPSIAQSTNVQPPTTQSANTNTNSGSAFDTSLLDRPITSPNNPPTGFFPLPSFGGTSPQARPTAAASSSFNGFNSGPAAAAGLTGKLAFEDGPGGTLYVYNLQTRDLWPIAQQGYDPAISPDGSTVVFTREGANKGIFLVDINGTNERKIFGEREELRSPKWRPDGEMIVFSRDAGVYHCRDIGFDICLLDDPFNPFLKQFPLVRKPEWDIARVDKNGANYRDIPALDSARAPDWSAHGIVYQSAGGLQKTDDLPPSETNEVIVSERYYLDPDWHSEGREIVFQSKEGSHWEIFRINPDGGGLQALTRPVTTLVDTLPSNVSPAWSYDNRHIVYVSNRDPQNDAGDWGIWVMEPDGRNQRRLPINVSINYTFAQEQMVSWGP